MGHKSSRKPVKPKKSLGQHFLIDPSISMDIADLVQDSGLPILEIGPGTGALTQHLLKRFPERTSVCEIDTRSIAYLKQHYPTIQTIYEEDFLRMNLKSLFPEGVIIVGNFPYNISSQIVFKVLENKSTVPQMVGMFQKEVAQRICSGPGSKQYGILSVLTKVHFSAVYEFEVDKLAFDPPPKVQSAVIQLKREEEFKLQVTEGDLKTIVKAAFNLRRKKLRNSLRSYFSDDQLQDSIFDLRPEQLSLADFAQLTYTSNLK